MPIMFQTKPKCIFFSILGLSGRGSSKSDLYCRACRWSRWRKNIDRKLQLPKLIWPRLLFFGVHPETQFSIPRTLLRWNSTCQWSQVSLGQCGSAQKTIWFKRWCISTVGDLLRKWISICAKFLVPERISIRLTDQNSLRLHGWGRRHGPAAHESRVCMPLFTSSLPKR